MSKRAACLYRVSTKGQLLADQNDIPMQKLECHAFADRMGFVIVKEYTELGISGYKVSEKDRDAVQEMRKDVQDGKFDVLIVFMCDRIGRKSDETPFVVEWLIKNGIEVYSTVEGQQTITTHVDKLTNYIRYWQAEGESEKTSSRVKAKQGQMIEAGEWTGGTVPYGYKLVPNGKIGKKNKVLNDLVKDPDQGILVSTIWDFVANKGYGTLRLANYLNEQYPASVYPFSKEWSARSIRSIIDNPIYKGSFRRNGQLSPVNEAWRYVSDDMWDLAQKAIANRITRKYPSPKRKEEDRDVPEGKTKASLYGATLLSGLLYCGHCGHRLVGTYHTRELKHGQSYHRPIYRCYNNATKAKGCDGPPAHT